VVAHGGRNLRHGEAKAAGAYDRNDGTIRHRRLGAQRCRITESGETKIQRRNQAGRPVVGEAVSGLQAGIPDV